MIAVDTSALMAILMDEPEAAACIDALSNADAIIVSAATMAEALIVARMRGIGEDMDRLLAGLGVEVIALTAAAARSVADSYACWGKGVHPASLNLGDCFAYALAQEKNCPLLYVGHDFSRTEIVSALSD